ncbi:unnamed protein product, partial [Adineta steineri]
VSKALLDIQNNQLVTVELLEEDDLQSQVEAMVQLVQATAYAQLTSFLRFVQMIYRSNTLVSALGTNAVVEKRLWWSIDLFYELRVSIHW